MVLCYFWNIYEQSNALLGEKNPIISSTFNTFSISVVFEHTIQETRLINAMKIAKEIKSNWIWRKLYSVMDCNNPYLAAYVKKRIVVAGDFRNIYEQNDALFGANDQ